MNRLTFFSIIGAWFTQRLAAQTLATRQMKLPRPQVTTLLGVKSPSGAIASITLGPGLGIAEDPQTGQIMLTITAQAPQSTYVPPDIQILTLEPDKASWRGVGLTAKSRIHCNGNQVVPGIGYTLEGNVVRPTATYGMENTDLWTAS